MTEINLQTLLLEELDKNSVINTLDLSTKLKIDHQKIVGCMMSIQTFSDVIICNPKYEKKWILSNEGNFVHLNGSHEFNIYSSIPNEGIDQKELMSNFKDPIVEKIGFSKAMQNGWIMIDKSNNKPLIKKKLDHVEDKIIKILDMIKNLKFDEIDEKNKSELKKRKLIEEVSIKSFDILKGSSFTLTLQKQETDLNSEMITKGTWKDKQFKTYNFHSFGITPERGHLHPLLKVREQYRQIFLEMGFTEMPTNNYVESSFWNFDSLFQPQQHPARDAHDTFFLNEPKNCNNLPDDYLEKVKNVHSKGGYGSQGYNYDWKLSDAQKNLLRTHTTAVSSKMLHKAANEYKKEKIIKPLKYFSIDKVFRNETLDATHLAEFFQIEGVVANVGLTLGDLMGILQVFFKKLGMENIKFKPAYNPYTEPSMEIFGYHKGLKKWVEIGNSGMFRPEMLLPMGLPEDLNVIAWGLSLERPTMIKYGINNIRSLCGHKIDLELIYNNPICILNS